MYRMVQHFSVGLYSLIQKSSCYYFTVTTHIKWQCTLPWQCALCCDCVLTAKRSVHCTMTVRHSGSHTAVCTAIYDCLDLEILRVTTVWLPELRSLCPGAAGRFLLLECAAASFWLDGFTLVQPAAAAQTTAITDHGAKSKVHGSASLSATSTLDLSEETQEKQIETDRVSPQI